MKTMALAAQATAVGAFVVPSNMAEQPVATVSHVAAEHALAANVAPVAAGVSRVSAASALAAGAMLGTAVALTAGKQRQRSGRRQGSSSTACRANPVAVFQTSMGTFKAELYLDKLPITASNFIDLAQSGFYDGVHFHRVIPNFMCQFGCPNAKDARSQKAGTGGPADGTSFTVIGTDRQVTRSGGGNIPDEFTAEIGNTPGTLSMANTGRPNTGGSQFFMNVADNSFLNYFDKSTPSKHPVFGKIIDNFELLEQISQVKTNNDNPSTPIMMEKITIEGLASGAA